MVLCVGLFSMQDTFAGTEAHDLANSMPEEEVGAADGENVEARLSNRTVWDDNESIGQIFDAGERFFLSLKKGEYSRVWDLLSRKSRETIINDVYKVYLQTYPDFNKQDIIDDFGNNGEKFKSYWNSFRRNFNTEIALEKSHWEIGAVQKNDAEILIQYYRSDNPTRLRLTREKNSWKVGLVETFWAGRGRRVLQSLFN
jgi:hypothetical protein